jgi:hypothetical protein
LPSELWRPRLCSQPPDPTPRLACRPWRRLLPWASEPTVVAVWLHRRCLRLPIPVTDRRFPQFRPHRDPRTVQHRPRRITAQLRRHRPRVVRARAAQLRVGRAQVAREWCAHQKMERRRPRRRHRPTAQLRPRRRHPLTVQRLPRRRQLRPVPDLYRPPHLIGAGAGVGGGATSERAQGFISRGTRTPARRTRRGFSAIRRAARSAA